MTPAPEDLAFARFRDNGDPADLAVVFDDTAPELQRVALHLADDAATAEDLVQATFLAAIESSERYDSQRRVRPWLVGILENQARLMRRDKGRRPDPGRLPERVQLTPHARAEHAELDAELDAAIEGLPEAYRSVLRLYLRHGMPAIEIAHSLGRPAGTVRTQIVRGLDRLRAALPLGLAGALAGLVTPARGMAAVRVVVVGAAAHRSGAAVTATAGVATGGLLLMKKTMMTAVGVLLAGVMVWALWPASSGPEPLARHGATPGVESLAAAGRDEKTATVPAPSGTNESGAARSALDGPVETVPGARLRGRVVDQNRVPVAGARVFAWAGRSVPVLEPSGEFRRAPDAETVTDEAGRFALPAVGETFSLAASTDAEEAALRVTGASEGRAEVDGIEIALAPMAALEGVVLDHRDAPVAKHPIRVTAARGSSAHDATDVPFVFLQGPVSHAIETDDDGRFRVRLVTDYNYHWEVQHPRHPMWRARHRTTDGPLEIRLECGAELRGRVFRAGGEAAAGAAVTLNDYPPRRATCAEDGTFHILGAWLRDASYLRIEDEGSALFALQPLPEDLLDIHVVLEPPAPIVGTVVDAAGQPVASARVEVRGDRRVDPGFSFEGVPTWEWSHDADTCETNGDGQFAFPDLYPGRFSVRAFPPGEEHLCADVDVASGGPHLVLRLDPVAMRRVVLRGKVIDSETEAPVEGCNVSIMRWEGGIGRGRSHATSAAGEFEAAGLWAGHFSIQAKAPGYAVAGVPVAEYANGTHEFTLRLEPARAIDVELVDLSGKPVRAHVSVRSASSAMIPQPAGAAGNTTSSLRTGDDGRVRLVGLPADVVTVVVESDAAARLEHSLDLRQPSADPVRIVVHRFAELRVRVMVLACGPKADLSAFENASDAQIMIAAVQNQHVWQPEAEITLELRSDHGARLAAATLTPTDERDDGMPAGWFWFDEKSHYRRDGIGYSTSGRAPWPATTLTGHCAPMRLLVSAEGHDDVTIEIDGTAESGPAVAATVLVWLR